MSLEDLEIKKHTDPIQKELELQKEKATKWKQAAIDWKRKAIQYASVISKFTLEMKPMLAKVKMMTEVEAHLLEKLPELSAAISGDIVQVGDLRRGDIVSSLRELDINGAKVRKGAKGVVYQPANFHESNSGPMVRWFDGGRCNVYDGDVAINEDHQKGEVT